MTERNEYVLHHNHSYYSNLRLTDAITSPRQLIETAKQYGYKGMSITEHESLSSAVDMIKTVKEMKASGELREDFRMLLGNEIYLVDSLEEVRDNYESGKTKFPHFCLIAKNRKGFEALSKLSTQAWKNSFFSSSIMERVPTEKGYLREVAQSDEYKGTLMASTACAGSPVNIYLQEKMLMEQTFDKEKIQEAHNKARNEVQWCIDTFGKDDFYIELQPADSPMQRYLNENLLEFAKEFDLKYIVACDTHYANKSHATIHAAFLNSKNEEREVEEFYKYTYMHSVDDIYKQMAYYLGDDVVKQALETTTELYNKSEDYDLAHSPIIPRAEIPEFELKHLFKPAYDKYKSLERLAYSDKKDERYMLHLLEEGYLRELHKEDITKEEFHQILARLDIEMEEILGVGDKINQTVSSYYITVRDIINTIWEEDTCSGYSGSLVGSGRGSSGGFLSLFLLGITQVNPLEHKNMPHFRHLHKSRGDFPDVDVDIESKRRQEVIRALKNKYGEDKVLNVATFTTAGTKSCIKIAARGLGIEDTEAQYIASLIPTERGQQYTLSDCLYGNEEKGRKKQQQFINEMEKYPELLKTALGLESIVVAKSQHAGGVIIFNDEIHKHSAMMKAAKGEASITQWSLKDSEYMGLVKFDLLSIDNLDRIRSTLELMEKDGVIESKGSLKDTFNEYLHPRALNHEDKRYYELASKGVVNDTFQFNTNIGIETLKRIKPENFEQFSAANSLMRLQSQEGKEPPMDIFIKHKENIQTWYDEMNDWGLTDSEIKVMEEHIGHTLGVSPVQEQAMGLSGDPRIANFTVEEQNKLRKAIAKPKGAALDEIKLLFYRKGEEQGTSKNLLDYVWETQFTPMFSYAFSSIHSNLYSIIGIQNLHLNLFYNPIYWQTACLNVDSGATSEDSEFLVDHEKIANGIGKIKEFGVEVKLPDINKSDFAFTPDADHNVIIYGLKPVKSLNSKTTHHIIENRPYNSIEDVFTKLYDNKLVTNTQLINMVKSGMLDNICESRKVAMMEVIRRITKVPETLTMQNVKTLIESGVLEDRPEEEIVLFKESFKNKVIRKEKQGKSNVKIFKVKDMELYDKLIGNAGIVNVTSSYYEIDEKQFKKAFEKKIKDLKEWLKSEEQLKKVQSYELNKQWIKYALGSYSKWEMETLSFYYHEHELSRVNKEMYNLSSYSELPEEPQVVDTFVFKGREFPKYKIDSIAGVVISKNASKNMVTIISTDGSVVPIKYQGNFSYYNKAVKRNGKIAEDSWFSKGNLLIVSGYRRGNQFVAKKYADSNTSTTTKLIDYVGTNGEVTYKLEREFV
ncbi:DNA polymerase III subunit alpha [Staphylococcus pseudintermedius]|nr:DNA polymerase III subunit alpha [Staphylococcus pseudintermedius]